MPATSPSEKQLAAWFRHSIISPSILMTMSFVMYGGITFLIIQASAAWLYVGSFVLKSKDFPISTARTFLAGYIFFFVINATYILLKGFYGVNAGPYDRYLAFALVAIFALPIWLYMRLIRKIQVARDNQNL